MYIDISPIGLILARLITRYTFSEVLIASALLGFLTPSIQFPNLSETFQCLYNNDAVTDGIYFTNFPFTLAFVALNAVPTLDTMMALTLQNNIVSISFAVICSSLFFVLILWVWCHGWDNTVWTSVMCTLDSYTVWLIKKKAVYKHCSS